MKKCDYCGLEITYDKQYCCDECNDNALKYYKNEKRYRGIFGFINVVSVIAVVIACFTALLFSEKTAMIIAGISLIIMGINVFIFPMPTLNQIKNKKIKKAVLQTRLIGIILSISGILLLICGIVK